jgi:hypothetical protein
MSRPTHIVRMVVDRVGGAVSADAFTVAELKEHFRDAAEDYADGIVDAITSFGHFEESDEEYLILFVDAIELKGLPQ